MLRLHLTLLGGFQARRGSGDAVALPTRKAQALLAYLALPLGRAHPRDKLASVLWGGIREESARASLRQALFSLRRALGGEASAVLRQEGDLVALSPAAVEVDVADFERAVATGSAESLARAAELYRGDLLAGLGVDETPFEEWLLGERERLRELALEGLAKLLAQQRKDGMLEPAVQTALRLLMLDPLQEPVHRTLMRLYAQLERRGAALRQYQQCVSVMQRELGVEPQAETKALYQEILRERPRRARPDSATERGELSQVVEHGALGATAETELIGRTADVEQLCRTLDAAIAGAGRVVAVLGEGGIGKSRLVSELGGVAAGRGMTVLLGRSYESEQILPFGPWVDAMRAGRIAADAELLARLGPTLRPELARLLPEIGDAPAAGSGATDARLVFESVAQLITQLAERRPVLVVLEDLHWADETSARLLAFAGRRLAGSRVVLIATAREEEMVDAPALRRAIDDLQREDRVTTLALRPLSRPDTLALVRAFARLGDEAELERVGERAWAASEGNPFVAVETVRAHADNAWVAHEGGLALSERVREIVGRRLERLSERGQSLAAVAAVIGREFEFTLLQRAAGLEGEEAAAGVEELVRRGVLQGVGERFDFIHDRIREVVSGRLLSPRRKLLHLRVAEALEAARSHDPDVEMLSIGLHYRDAEVWDKAVTCLRQASLLAAQRAAYREAASGFDHALAALRRLPQSREGMELAYEINSELRGAAVPPGDLRKQVEALREMETIAQALDDRDRLRAALSASIYTLGALGDHPGAVRAGERARALRAEAGDLLGQAGSDSMMSRAYYAMGQYSRTIEAATRAYTVLTGKLMYERSTRLGLLQSIAARVWAAMALAERGDFVDANARVDEAIHIAEVDQGTHERVWSRFGGGRVAFVQGDLERAVALLEPILILARGDLGVYVSRIASTLGSAYLFLGRTAEALTLLEQAADHGRAIGFLHGHSLVLALLAEGYLRAGRLDDASRTAAEALELARKQGERGWEAWTLRLLGELDCERSAADAATRYGEALALAVELGMRPLQAHCRRGLAGVIQARSELSAAIALYREMGMTFWLRRAEVDPA
ncbi:MAG: hypothetical protein DME04_15475 [Candidatus Rokuibacteriota bacterium]|nr:MAG: hypothetical protein DME04_15475 [Candidatus Rokubacteria bacterium]